MDLLIRPLEERDTESVGGIFDLYWRDDFRNNLSDKLSKYFQNDPSLVEQNFEFIVAEVNSEVVGVAAIRKAPQHMKEYATTGKPTELYVAAVKEPGKGVGSALTAEVLKEAKEEGYTEMVLFSGETHQDSWEFHDKNFERASAAIAPNGEKGFIWRKSL